MRINGAFVAFMSLGSNIRRLPLRSSVLADACYDARVRIMDVVYTDGSSYRFYEVPDDIWSAFCEAESRGRFFMDAIRERFPRSRKP